jgi:hypothetical protein
MASTRRTRALRPDRAHDSRRARSWLNSRVRRPHTMAQSNLDPRRIVQLLMKDAVNTIGDSIRAEGLAVAASVERKAQHQRLAWRRVNTERPWRGLALRRRNGSLTARWSINSSSRSTTDTWTPRGRPVRDTRVIRSGTARTAGPGAARATARRSHRSGGLADIVPPVA